MAHTDNEMKTTDDVSDDAVCVMIQESVQNSGDGTDNVLLPRNIPSANADIEDLTWRKKRKTLDAIGTKRKKLCMSKQVLNQRNDVFCNEMQASACECVSRVCEGKENCVDKTRTENEKCKCYQENIEPGSSTDFLQIMKKPIVISKTKNLSNEGFSYVKSGTAQKNWKMKEIKNLKTSVSDVLEQQAKELNVKSFEAHGKRESLNLSAVETVTCSKEDEVKKSSVIENKEQITGSEKLDELEKIDVDEFDIFSEEWNLEDVMPTKKDKGDLDLSRWQRCEVTEVHEGPGREKTLQLHSLCTVDVATCVLEGVWSSMKIKSGAVLSVKAFKDSQDTWIINNNNGFLIQSPDLLLAPTSIVGSISCMRQGVLNNLFSRSAHDTSENCKLLATGCLIHELLQQVLTQGTDSPECIASLIEDIISSSCNVRLMYSSKMSLQEAREELLKIVPAIYKFCKRYSVWGQDDSRNALPASEQDSNVYEGKFSSVISVEDNFWVPQLGMKGKVDITVMARRKDQKESQFMPVEVKTGAMKHSAEHRGQVILYCLMAAQITPGVSGGLLVYLREGFARSIEVGHAEQRDIIMLRNKLAQYLPHFSSQEATEENITLPRPTNNSRVCQWCSQQTVCCAFLNTSEQCDLFTNSSAHDIRAASIEHLSPEHLEYVVHWSNLLWLEEKEKPKNSLNNIWSVPAVEREKKGRCLSDLKLVVPVSFKSADSYFHVFKRKNENVLFSDLNCIKFSVGQMVLVSTDYRVAIAFGIVVQLNSRSMTVDVPRDLSKVIDVYGDTYSLDMYEPQSYFSWVLGNLSALLDNKESSAHLRRLVINCDVPLFDDENACQSLKAIASPFALNESQHKAVRKALLAHDYVLLRGLPGTGKSTTVAVIIQQLVLQKGCSVLLTAHTHSAVDTVLQKLSKLNVPFLRIGSLARVHEAIHPWTEHNLTTHCTTPEMLEREYNSKPVVAATCLGMKHPLFSRRFFDVCIVDESTQVLQPVILGPLLRAKKFILVGDPEQLPPLVRNAVASKKGLSNCLFTHLLKQDATVCLDLQYRMNSKITDLANDLTYEGALKCASTATATATVQLNTKNIPHPLPCWLEKVLSSDIQNSVVLLNVSNGEKKERTSDCTNKKEAALVNRLTEVFLQCGVKPDTVGVMAPYRDQVAFLQASMKSTPEIEINTVDQYQGRDKDIIVFSCTNNWGRSSTSENDSCILNDKRRLTVAITRAKYKLVILGDVQALQCFAPMKHIFSSIGNGNTVEVKD